MDDRKALLIIRKTAKTTANETLKAFKIAGFVRVTTNYHKTEDILKAFPTYEKHIKEMKLDIQDIIREGRRRRSPDVLLFSTSGGSGEIPGITSTEEKTEDLQELIKLKKESLMSTRREIRRINRALRKVRADPYFYLIKEYYFGYEDIWPDPEDPEKTIEVHKTYSINQIMDIHEITERTVKTEKSRLVKYLTGILFGAG